MDVEVMYGHEKAGSWSFQRERVKPDEIHRLESDRVLFMILSAPCAERPRKDGNRRVAEMHGYDNYVLARTHHNGDSFLMLDGWDDHRFSTWHMESDPFKSGCNGGAVKRGAPPLGVFHRVFTGVTVPADIWQEALKLFESEMH